MLFTCNDDFLVTCGLDKEIIVWDFPNKTSIATFTSHCKLEDLSVSDDLSSIIFRPLNVDYVGILKPNAMLGRISRKEDCNTVPSVVQQAQSFALAFSPQKATGETSRACVIL